jgi:hypothetical protein
LEENLPLFTLVLVSTNFLLYTKLVHISPCALYIHVYKCIYMFFLISVLPFLQYLHLYICIFLQLYIVVIILSISISLYIYPPTSLYIYPLYIYPLTSLCYKSVSFKTFEIYPGGSMHT